MQLFNKKTLLKVMILLIFFNIGTAYCANETQQIKKVEQKRTDIRKKINSLEKLEKKQTSIISKNQQKLEKNQNELKNSQKEKEAKEKNLKKLKEELDNYVVLCNKRNLKLAERIRYIYKTKHTLILDLLVSTDSISQFLDRIYYQNLIIKSDRQKIYKLRAEARDISNLKKKMENEQKQLARIIKGIKKENSGIQSIIKQNKSILQKIQKDKKAYEKSERELAKQSEYLAKLISKSTQNSSVTVKGNFILPVSGARISSPFGWRIHPIFKSKIFHTGIDYAIAYGTPIKASNSGKVIYSGWYGGYGKVVILDHGSCTGSPTTTLYAHMSSQKVNVGQFVNQGDIIGYVGSTGYSTGPHVHFEVRINGKPQNPKDFL